jgi:copper chaperone CopZ
MPSEVFNVRYVKCEGCATAIKNGLTTLAGVEEVDVVVETGDVTVRGGNIPYAEIRRKLAELGYPAEDP